ncbi:MAG: bifunctional adenosylcobinamide kinase/adenosylcobinamide-phosphate guanylyltransferase [Oscillospiraceae bacterium]|jgi:adenosylcobinamide kinase/adenosylcobinamide-phosphate guanylyltransferase|nr:bifunctional adenosylcobinamide kinase/adenosylcobinamide-phosphate guanylyltransferase [Oscillospiraceae bacterium]
MTILVIGGSASGKSEFAEQLAVSMGEKRFYVATMEPFGAEGAARIARHREMRAERGFETVERYTDIASLFEGGDARSASEGVVPTVALLEDIGNLVANEIFTVGGENVAERVTEGVLSLAAQCGTLVVVSNDISRDAERYDAETSDYLAAVGDVNRRLAAVFDEVYEVTNGVAAKIKGAL